MVVSHLGYLFEGRKDMKGNMGIMENYNILFSGDTQQVSVVLATDIKGNPLIPAYNDASLGFRPLVEMLSDGESHDKTMYRYTKSNKPYFGVLGAFSMLCDLKIKFDRNTGELLEEPVIHFYAPKNVVPSLKAIAEKEKDVPALSCDRLSVKAGLNTIQMNEKLLESFKANVLKSITKDTTTSRDVYLLSRLRL